jgi:hypothetical protein
LTDRKVVANRPFGWLIASITAQRFAGAWSLFQHILQRRVPQHLFP